MSLKRSLEFPPLAPERAASKDASPEPARFVRSFVSLRTSPSRHQPIKIALPSHLFSSISAHIKKSGYLIENTKENQFSKSLVFNQLRTLFHSFPASPVFSICSPKQRGYTPPGRILIAASRPIYVSGARDTSLIPEGVSSSCDC